MDLNLFETAELPRGQRVETGRDLPRRAAEPDLDPDFRLELPEAGGDRLVGGGERKLLCDAEAGDQLRKCSSGAFL